MVHDGHVQLGHQLSPAAAAPEPARGWCFDLQAMDDAARTAEPPLVRRFENVCVHVAYKGLMNRQAPAAPPPLP